MKDTGIIRRLDELNRITLPKEFELSLGLEKRQPLEIWVDDEKIVLRKYVSHKKCTFCGSEKNVVHHVDKPVCKNCINTMRLRHYD